VHAYLQLHACSEQLDAWPYHAPLATLVEPAAAVDCANAWLAIRRANLTYPIGRACERRAVWGGGRGPQVVCGLLGGPPRGGGG
ncbi:VRR-NUC domain-containing protein, partial [Burkholderia pseudomallei]